MLIVMRRDAKKKDINDIEKIIKSKKLKPIKIPGGQRTAIGIIGNDGPLDKEMFENLSGVLEAINVTKPYKLVSRDFQNRNTSIRVGKHTISKKKLTIIAGPCAVESEKQIIKTAKFLKKNGVHILRGGAYKPRTSPYSFQGLGEEGLKLLAKAKKLTGLPIISEAVDTETIETVAHYSDIVQIGARNMQNYSLLKKAGQLKKTVLLKRGLAATIKEFLMAAEYIMAEGNKNVILCERGIRTFSDHSRFTLDLNAVPVINKISHLPIFVDPSHSAGNWEFVKPMALASIAAGADGLMIEVHPDPNTALSDGSQSLTFKKFKELYKCIL